MVVEQKCPLGNHAFEYANSVNHRGHPGHVAFDTGGLVIAMLVGGGLVLVAADQVPSEFAVGVGFGVRTTPGPQAQDGRLSRRHRQ
jgi:hypothetical protein